MVDLTKPCRKCGAVDRDPRGRCKPCQSKRQKKYRESEKNREKASAWQREYRKSGKGREVRKAADRRYKQSEKGREATKAANRRYCLDLTKPCRKCGAVDRYKCGVCKACTLNYQKTYRHSEECRESKRKYMIKYFASAENRERKRVGKSKHKKLNFEFSLQNQQKAIEQCQQKLTQPNEIS